VPFQTLLDYLEAGEALQQSGDLAVAHARVA